MKMSCLLCNGTSQVRDCLILKHKSSDELSSVWSTGSMDCAVIVLTIVTLSEEEAQNRFTGIYYTNLKGRTPFQIVNPRMKLRFKIATMSNIV